MKDWRKNCTSRMRQDVYRRFFSKNSSLLRYDTPIRTIPAFLYCQSAHTGHETSEIDRCTGHRDHPNHLAKHIRNQDPRGGRRVRTMTQPDQPVRRIREVTSILEPNGHAIQPRCVNLVHIQHLSTIVTTNSIRLSIHVCGGLTLSRREVAVRQIGCPRTRRRIEDIERADKHRVVVATTDRANLAIDQFGR